MKKAIVILVLGLFCTVSCITGTTERKSSRFTLSDDDLMLLDRHFQHYSTSEVISKTDIAGPGVEFEIYFPDINGPGHSIYYVSCENGGEGLLTGIDISDFNAFSLKLTLVSVNGSNSPDAAGSLVVGALINSPRSYAYRPEVVSLKPQRNSAVSTTKTDGAKDVSIIGFTAHPFTPKGWDPNGSTIKLLVEAAPRAELLR
jgi:hypothetical protein